MGIETRLAEQAAEIQVMVNGKALRRIREAAPGADVEGADLESQLGDLTPRAEIVKLPTAND